MKLILSVLNATWVNVKNTTVPRLNTGTDPLVPIVMLLVLNVKELVLLTVPFVTPLNT